MARKTKADLEAEREALEQEIEREEKLAKYEELAPKLLHTEELEKENARLRGEITTARLREKHAAEAYQLLTDEWNYCTAKFKLPPPKFPKERPVIGAFARRLAEKLIGWTEEGMPTDLR